MLDDLWPLAVALLAAVALICARAASADAATRAPAPLVRSADIDVAGAPPAAS